MKNEPNTSNKEQAHKFVNAQVKILNSVIAYPFSPKPVANLEGTLNED